MRWQRLLWRTSTDRIGEVARRLLGEDVEVRATEDPVVWDLWTGPSGHRVSGTRIRLKGRFYRLEVEAST